MANLRARLVLSFAAVTTTLSVPLGALATDDARWRDEWPRFRSWQYATTTALLGAGIATRYLAPAPQSSFGAILFDDALAEHLSIRNESARWATAIATDGIFYALIGYRAVDSTLVPGAAHDDWVLAQQMTAIDLQAYAVIAAALWIPQAFVGRERPIVRQCEDPEVREHELVCDSGHEQRHRSFVSGHVAVAVAAASLTCVHHAFVPLYGGGMYDDIACDSTIGLASLVAVGRTISLNHWASDVVLGALLGFGAGYALPTLLHYGFDGSGAGTGSFGLGTRSHALPAFTLGGNF